MSEHQEKALLKTRVVMLGRGSVLPIREKRRIQVVYFNAIHSAFSLDAITKAWVAYSLAMADSGVGICATENTLPPTASDCSKNAALEWFSIDRVGRSAVVEVPANVHFELLVDVPF
jgi:hypothetical protein